MRVGIKHVTGFSYADPVRASFNQARMTPINTPDQTVWSSRITVDPTPWSYTLTDYYGTLVTTFEVHESHDRLTVSSDIVVDTHHDQSLDVTRELETDLSFPELLDTSVRDEFAEFLEFSPRVGPHPDLVTALSNWPDAKTPREAALDACSLIYDHLRYQSGASQVSSVAADIWADGRGVCQDFSHVTIGALRSLGIPTRYVSGYLHPGSEDKNQTVDAESHSWVEWWCGSWVAFDPTANSQIGNHYVRVGHGRDYGDVPPLRGTYAGGESDMFVTVRLTQLG